MNEYIGSVNSQSNQMSAWRIYLAPIIGGIFVPMMFLWAPLVSLQMDKELGFSSETVGFIFMVEILTGMFANALAYFWLKTKINWYHLFICMIVLTAVLNFISGLLIKEHFNLFMATRVLAAITGSTIFIITNSCMALLSNPYRAFSIALFSQIILGSLGLFLLPFFLEKQGIFFVYFSLSLLLLCVLPFTQGIQVIWRKKEDNRSQVKPRDRPPQKNLSQTRNTEVYLCLLGIFLFNLVVSGVWTFIGGYLAALKVELTTVYHILSSSSMVGILGAGTSILFRKKVNLVGLLCFLSLIGSILVLYLNINIILVIISCYAFKYIWTLALPFTMSIAAEYEVDGNIMNLVSLSLGLGIAMGPMVSGALIERVDFAAMFLFHLIALALSTAIIIKVTFRSNRTRSENHEYKSQ